MACALLAGCSSAQQLSGVPGPSPEPRALSPVKTRKPVAKATPAPASLAECVNGTCPAPR